MSMFKGIRLLFGQGLRIFFFAAGLYALFSVGIWVGWLALTSVGDAPKLSFAPPPVHWHAHEMIYGYAAAVLAGFFLTAVPTWTGERSARAALLSVLAALWLAGRLAIWWSGAIAPVVVAAVDLAVLRTSYHDLGLLILMLWAGDVMVHLDWMGVAPGLAVTGLRLGLLTVATMIAIIGGRVIPAFTRNAMLREGREDGLPVSRPKLEKAGIGSAIALPLLVAVDVHEPIVITAALAAGLTQAARLAGWRGQWTRDQPILWSLHLAYAMLALGYLALAAAHAGLIGEVGALHVLGIGAIGGMTLAMMSRAALGHTGRPLVTPRPVAWSYALVALAAVVRVAGSEVGDWYDTAMLASGGLWLAAFALFLAVYWPILTAPRLDSAP